MKSKISKLAAAAVIIIAVMIGINQFGGSIDGTSVAWADVVKPILSARTITYKQILSINGKPSLTTDNMFMEPAHFRTTFPNGTIVVKDFYGGDQYRILTLNPRKKIAFIIERQHSTPPEYSEDSGISINFLEIRKQIQEAQQNENISVKFLGEQEIDGLRAVGYILQNNREKITIWADAETMLPIQIERPSSQFSGLQESITITDFDFDVDLDESLFSLKPPKGYNIYNDTQLGEPIRNEKSLIETLYLWTDTVDGQFPPVLNMTLPDSFRNRLGNKMGLKKDKEHLPSKEQMQEFMATLKKFIQGIIFVHALPTESNWCYVGKDVEYGDANTAIFWYRPQDSETYRVIYGDLTVEDVAPEDLPK